MITTEVTKSCIDQLDNEMADIRSCLLVYAMAQFLTMLFIVFNSGIVALVSLFISAALIFPLAHYSRLWYARIKSLTTTINNIKIIDSF